MIRELKIIFFNTLALLPFCLVFVVSGLISTASTLAPYFGPAALANVSAQLLNVAMLILFSRPSRREVAMIFGVGLVTAPLFIWMVPNSLADFPLVRLFNGLAGIGLGGGAALVLRLRDPGYQPAAARTPLAACLLAPLGLLATKLSLELTAALHPTTLDLYLYKFDRTLGFPASQIFGLVAQVIPGLHAVWLTCYQPKDLRGLKS